MNLGYILHQWAGRQGDKVAIVFEGLRLTYGELEARVNALCHAFVNFGLKNGDRVAVLTYNNYQFMELFFACARMGMVLVPLNFRLVGGELGFHLNHSESKILFLGEEFQEVVGKIRPQLESVRRFIVIGEDRLGLNVESYQDIIDSNIQNSLLMPYDIDLNAEFLIIYTSGTTGRPKGAVLTQLNVLFSSINQIIDYQCTAKDINLVMTPMFHVGGSLILTFPVLHSGGTSVIMKSFDALKALEFIEKEKVTLVFGVPAMWTAIRETHGVEDANLSSVRFCITGGAAQPVAIMKKLYEAFHFPILEGYGLSEGASATCFVPLKYTIEKAGSIGKPFIHNVMRVVNESGKDVKAGEVGEIVLKGPTIMKEYFKDPRATREAIINGWLHTGDLATVDEEGFVYIKDRKKDMIISGGENIYPAEIEQVLQAHPKILEAAVIGIPNDKWGEEVRAIVALKPNEKMTQEEMIEYCKQELASYKKPQSVIFLENLPRNPSGKVLKTVLREKYSMKSL